jgi:glycosyltransferase involved in cell wall biosynthesis
MSFGDKPTSLSVAIITLNEEDRIERLLSSVCFVKDIVIVDSGSTDRTREICEGFDVRFYHHDWEGYVRQKQFALGLATGDWILSLDADEVITDEGRCEILSSLANADATVNGFSFPRLSRYLNRWIRHGGWFPDRKVRLVRRGMGRWIGEALHEKLEVTGRVQNMVNPILHYVYRDISDQINTINHFSSTFAAEKKCRFPGFYVVLGIFHAIGKFLECAIWKLGLLDGLPGLIIALNSAFYIFLKHAKTWERSATKTS